MAENLQELGTILLTNTVQNDHFRIGGIVLEDRETLGQFMHSLMAIDRVVYLVITASDGRILDQQSKRTRRMPGGSPKPPSNRSTQTIAFPSRYSMLPDCSGHHQIRTLV